MGYSTSFKGQFNLNKPLTDAHAAYLRRFNETRREARDVTRTINRPDPIRKAVGLPLGIEGEFFVGEGGYFGQSHNEDLLKSGPPCTQPGWWCQWIPNDDNTAIVWDEGEKFYDYIEWIQYMIKNFFEPWGYVLNGQVKWRGEDCSDTGIITIENNIVNVTKGKK